MTIEPEYQRTLDYLYSFVDFSIQKTFHTNPPKFDLDKILAFVKALGNPHQGYPIIHVAGTKGKGSVSAMCASALKAAGYRVGFYISPHLHDYNERIQIDNQPIPHAVLVSLVEELKPIIGSIPQITTFEITTGLAFTYFKRQKVNAAVIEVGLGGRLDATNVVTPVISVITSLSYDHMFLLGNTLTEIAGEKAGIIKPGIPIISSPQKDEALSVLKRIASERSAPFYQMGDDYRYAPFQHDLRQQTLFVWPKADQAKMNGFLAGNVKEEWQPRQLQIHLLGYHQVENAATAYAALQVARNNGLPISEDNIWTGFSRVTWPGRFEVLRKEPPLVVDSAHNRDSALKLRLALADYFPGRPVILIFGASEDKDIQGMLAELTPCVRKVITTKANHPRAMDPDALVDLVHRFGRPARAMDNIPQALEAALNTGNNECVVLAAGSIFMSAEVRQAWLEKRYNNA